MHASSLYSILFCALPAQEEDRDSQDKGLADAAHHYIVYNAGMRLLYMIPDVSTSSQRVLCVRKCFYAYYVY